MILTFLIILFVSTVERTAVLALSHTNQNLLANLLGILQDRLGSSSSKVRAVKAEIIPHLFQETFSACANFVAVESCQPYDPHRELL